MKRIRWATSARDDLARIDDHYVRIAPEFADAFGRKAIAAARLVVDHPAMGPLVAPDVRQWRVRGTPYLLVYRIVAGGIEIVDDRQDRLPPP